MRIELISRHRTLTHTLAFGQRTNHPKPTAHMLRRGSIPVKKENTMRSVKHEPAGNTGIGASVDNRTLLARRACALGKVEQGWPFAAMTRTKLASFPRAHILLP